MLLPRPLLPCHRAALSKPQSSHHLKTGFDLVAWAAVPEVPVLGQLPARCLSGLFSP